MTAFTCVKFTQKTEAMALQHTRMDESAHAPRRRRGARHQTIIAARREFGGGREDVHIAVWEGEERDQTREKGEAEEGRKKKEKADRWRETGRRQILQFGETKEWRAEGKERGQKRGRNGKQKGREL